MNEYEGLTMGSIPFLLQSKASYTEIGIFSLSSYPYSLKLFWSPIVDAIFSDRILTIQPLAVCILYLSLITTTRDRKM